MVKSVLFDLWVMARISAICSSSSHGSRPRAGQLIALAIELRAACGCGHCASAPPACPPPYQASIRAIPGSFCSSFQRGVQGGGVGVEALALRLAVAKVGAGVAWWLCQ